MVPYLLGAGVGTFSDSLLVALALTSSGAVLAILALAGVVALVTGGLIATGPWYRERIATAHDLLLSSPRRLAWGMVVLLVAPLGLILLP